MLIRVVGVNGLVALDATPLGMEAAVNLAAVVVLQPDQLSPSPDLLVD